jgi:hypothetical protein
MYVIRHNDLKESIDSKRNLVKLSDPNLWKPPQKEGIEPWIPGHEIRNEAIGISLFKTGTTDEKVHYHEKTWELYQVLNGSLIVAVKQFRKDKWKLVNLEQYDMLLLAPGTPHLVDPRCNHLTQVIQTPPTLSDQITITKETELFSWGDIDELQKLIGLNLGNDGTVEQEH